MVLTALDSPERFSHESGRNTETGSGSRNSVPASSPVSISNSTATPSFGPNHIKGIHNWIVSRVSEAVRDRVREEVKAVFDSLRDGLCTNVNGRLQEVADVALPEAVRKTVTEQVPAMVNSKLFKTAPLSLSRSLEERLPALEADQVTVVMDAMAQQPATISREQLLLILQKYFEQRFL